MAIQNRLAGALLKMTSPDLPDASITGNGELATNLLTPDFPGDLEWLPATVA